MKCIGYLRVSTDDQNTEKNKSDILFWANNRQLGPVHWVEEKVSGCKDWKKRKLFDLVESLGQDDWLIVPEFSRLARSTLQILEILAELKKRGTNCYVIKGSQLVNGSIESKVFVTLMSLFSEIERDLISARTIEGLKARKAAGVKLGRPRGPGKSKLDQYRPEIESLLKNGATLSFVAKRYKTIPSNLVNWLKKNGIDRKAIPELS
jgi:DNA invertase Pin-like site-specific DNA recombinase